MQQDVSGFLKVQDVTGFARIPAKYWYVTGCFRIPESSGCYRMFQDSCWALVRYRMFQDSWKFRMLQDVTGFLNGNGILQDVSGFLRGLATHRIPERS